MLFRSVKSAALYCRVLEQEGFQVEKDVCGISTAFTASFGSGRPHIGILAEYDALSGLSQKAGSLTQEELVPGGYGHGCGHNLLGAGALAAALGVKAYLEQAGVPGTVTLYGCPGEEGGAAKAFMARDGLGLHTHRVNAHGILPRTYSFSDEGARLYAGTRMCDAFSGEDNPVWMRPRSSLLLPESQKAALLPVLEQADPLQ